MDRSRARVARPFHGALTAQAAFLLCHRDWQQPWWRVAAYLSLLIVLGGVVWAGDTVLRVVLPMTVAFNVLVARRLAHAAFWTWLIAGNANLVYRPEGWQILPEGLRL